MSEKTIVSEALAEGSEQESFPDAEDYQQRAQKEIAGLKAQHAAEVSALKEQVQTLRDAVKDSLSCASQESGLETPSKTAGVKQQHRGARSVLAAAASQAHQTGSRTDVQEYLRLRRKYV